MSKKPASPGHTAHAIERRLGLAGDRGGVGFAALPADVSCSERGAEAPEDSSSSSSSRAEQQIGAHAATEGGS